MVLLLLLLLHHGNGSRVIYRGCDEVLLGCCRHAGHCVVLGQRAASPWSCLILKLAATVHPLGGEIKERLQLDQQAAKYDKQELCVYVRDRHRERMSNILNFEKETYKAVLF